MILWIDGSATEEGMAAITDSDNIRERVFAFYKDDLDKINTVLKEFLTLSESKCLLLIDKDGHLVTKAGESRDIDLSAVAALVAGSYAATRQMARLLGEDEFSVLFHQGRKDSVQLTLVGERTLLATVFDETTTLGMVRLYSKEASEKLAKIFDEIHSRNVKVNA
jgi:predicted regulator of Ras-like GTPase activity (Roadblock/LC7/MglB family)